MNLSQWSLLLGALQVLAGLLAFLSPGPFGRSLRRFPRQVVPGIVLMLAGTAWFVWNLYSSNLTDFQEWRPIMYAGFTLLGVGCCFFVQDYLSVRGACVVALLVCDRVLEAGRSCDSDWRALTATWCYLVICLSVWWVGSPWRVRDLADWLTAVPGRLPRAGLGFTALGATLIGLGVSVLR
jgi:hypothetical protein